MIILIKRRPCLQTRKTSEPEGSHYENLKLFTIHRSKHSISVIFIFKIYNFMLEGTIR
jgi:hypothetical protein